MNDIPYTTPEEDPFNVRPVFLQPRRRRSSLLDKWIQEQQKPPDSDPPPPALLAYPEGSLPNPSTEDVVTLENYDLIDDDDIPAAPNDEEVPATPTTTRSKRTSKLLHTPASFRSFKPFRSASPAVASHADGGTSSPRSSRFLFLPRVPRLSTDATLVGARTPTHQHTRSASFATLGFSATGNTPALNGPNSVFSTRSRPSVLGHFTFDSMSQASAPSDTAYTPSRPSISSGETYASGTATTESEFPMTPSRMNFMDSLRFKTKSNGSVFSSASAIFSSGSLPSRKAGSSQGHGSPVPPADGSNQNTLSHRSQTTRIPLAPKPGSKLANSNINHDTDDEDDDNEATCHAVKLSAKQASHTRPHVAYSSGGTLPRVSLASLSSRHRKKKKLVVRGVGANDLRKFEGVRQWCESFGEVSQIVRMPNGDLHVHFRLAEVADTVCRLRAKVYIAGVGSVQLSWLTGDKR
ncbi:hypothetical protein H0H87_004529 [Tephrocybe sp. NHM501043]|nr:hypothetical protein H0H87_004529 [Tephrocybe sp. NHM501043]